VAHVLPASDEPRLVVDIGGGSTEFIIGRALVPERLESLKIGCVGMTRRFFADGALSPTAFAEADTVARAEVEAIAREFHRDHWRRRTHRRAPRCAGRILEQNGLSAAGITRGRAARLRANGRRRSHQTAPSRRAEAGARAGARGRTRHHGGSTRRTQAARINPVGAHCARRALPPRPHGAP
jgi:hypothetical protein